LVLGASGAMAETTPTPTAAAPACDCHRFADELAAARAVYASRGEGATSPPSQAARTRFRERILDAYACASPLVACDGLAAADPPDGAATRAEASVLMRAPSVAGGDLKAARQLMQAASAAPIFACTVDNRILLAETVARTGDGTRAVAELRAALAAGLPTCGD